MLDALPHHVFAHRNRVHVVHNFGVGLSVPD